MQQRLLAEEEVAKLRAQIDSKSYAEEQGGTGTGTGTPCSTNSSSSYGMQSASQSACHSATEAAIASTGIAVGEPTSVSVGDVRGRGMAGRVQKAGSIDKGVRRTAVTAAGKQQKLTKSPNSSVTNTHISSSTRGEAITLSESSWSSRRSLLYQRSLTGSWSPSSNKANDAHTRARQIRRTVSSSCIRANITEQSRQRGRINACMESTLNVAAAIDVTAGTTSAAATMTTESATTTTESATTESGVDFELSTWDQVHCHNDGQSMRQSMYPMIGDSYRQVNLVNPIQEQQQQQQQQQEELKGDGDLDLEPSFNFSNTNNSDSSSSGHVNAIITANRPIPIGTTSSIHKQQAAFNIPGIQQQQQNKQALPRSATVSSIPAHQLTPNRVNLTSTTARPDRVTTTSPSKLPVASTRARGFR